MTSPNPAAPSEQDRESASRLLLEIEKCLFSEDTDHRCTCIEKIMAHVASLRRELADSHKALVREREFNHDLAIACKGNKLNASATGEAIAREDAAVLRQENHQLRDQLAALRRELAEARRDGERLWQPMETAPRDGTAVLLSIEDSVDAAIFWKEQWLFRGEIPLTGEPDAWMPLPKPQAAARPSKP